MKKGENVMYRVLVSGYYGFGNAGDEAILMAIVESIKKLNKDIEITALSAAPEKTLDMHGIRAVTRTNPGGVKGNSQGGPCYKRRRGFAARCNKQPFSSLLSFNCVFGQKAQ